MISLGLSLLESFLEVGTDWRVLVNSSPSGSIRLILHAMPPLANRMEVAELRMLRWTCGKMMLDMINNGVYRAELEVETIINKMREGRLRWFGHVRRRPQSAPVRRVEALAVDGMRRRGRPKLRWEDRVKLNMKELLLFEDMTFDRNE
ncbi:hypothetical protein Tco_0969854 [Tanacetum coccineum]